MASGSQWLNIGWALWMGGDPPPFNTSLPLLPPLSRSTVCSTQHAPAQSLFEAWRVPTPDNEQVPTGANTNAYDCAFRGRHAAEGAPEGGLPPFAPVPLRVRTPNSNSNSNSRPGVAVTIRHRPKIPASAGCRDSCGGQSRPLPLFRLPVGLIPTVTHGLAVHTQRNPRTGSITHRAREEGGRIPLGKGHQKNGTAPERNRHDRVAEAVLRVVHVPRERTIAIVPVDDARCQEQQQGIRIGCRNNDSARGRSNFKGTTSTARDQTCH